MHTIYNNCVRSFSISSVYTNGIHNFDLFLLIMFTLLYVLNAINSALNTCRHISHIEIDYPYFIDIFHFYYFRWFHWMETTMCVLLFTHSHAIRIEIVDGGSCETFYVIYVRESNCIWFYICNLPLANSPSQPSSISLCQYLIRSLCTASIALFRQPLQVDELSVIDSFWIIDDNG